MARRTRGEGSIYKEGEYWTAAITIDGKKMVKRCKRQDEARRWLVDTRSKAAQGLLAPEGYKQYVADYLNSWLETHRAAIKPKTAVQYECLLRIHIIPALGKCKLGDLRPQHLQSLYSRKLKEGLAPRTVQLLHIVLHRALKQALLWGLVPRNVADAVEPPRPQRSELVVWTPEQTRAFLEAARG
ncbi:MAG: site-specific integrase, partial [Chloroflexota bacterium]